MDFERIPCPYRYAEGKKCPGYITHTVMYKADLEWSINESGQWTLNFTQARSHVHLSCSEKGNHAGYRKPDDAQMKFYPDKLPPKVEAIVFGDAVVRPKQMS